MPSRSSPNLSSAEITLLRDHFGDPPGGDELMDYSTFGLIEGRHPDDDTNYPRPYFRDGNVYFPEGRGLVGDYSSVTDTIVQSILVHEAWHAVQAEHLGSFEGFMKRYGSSMAGPKDYNYEDFLEGNANWQDLNPEAQSSFMQHLYILENSGNPGNDLEGTPMKKYLDENQNISDTDIRPKLPSDYKTNPISSAEDAEKKAQIDRAEENPDRTSEAKEGLDNAEQKASPLILDLNKNGQIDLVSKANSHAYFELTGDHMAEHTGWVNGASGDGLLVWDRNNDGKINSINELFGSQTEEGFAKLALLDSNADGKMSSADANWSKLKLWVDANSNGITEAGELKTLASYQIASINLANTRVMQTVEGNTITNDGLFTYANGATGKISDIWFAYDPWNTVYNNNYTLDLRALFLPSIRGYGEIANLHKKILSTFIKAANDDAIKLKSVA